MYMYMNVQTYICINYYIQSFLNYRKAFAVRSYYHFRIQCLNQYRYVWLS